MRKSHAILLSGTGLAAMFFAWQAGEESNPRGRAGKDHQAVVHSAVESAAGPSQEMSRSPVSSQAGVPQQDMRAQTAQEGAAGTKEGTPQAAAAVAPEMGQALEAIEQASITYDPAQLPTIRPYLYHPSKEVREAALHGIVNLGDSSGARLLRDAANVAGSTEEKLELLKMAEYLELPPTPKGFKKITGTKR